MTFPQVKFKRVLDRNDGGTWGDDPVGSGDTVVLRSTEQTADGRWAIKEPELRFVAPQDAERYLLRKGDLLITKSSGSTLHIGKTTIVDSTVANLRAIYSNFMQRVRLSGNESPKYFWYVLRTPWIREQWVLNSTSTTGLANLNADSIGQLLVPHPPLDEQRQIAEYLDRETGKIDELIAKQEQLVKVLAERRDALIAGTVTRGMSLDGPLLASAEWFGNYPLHWKIGRVGNAFQLTLGKMLNATSKASGELHPYMRAGNIQESGVDLTEVKLMHFTTQEAASLTLKQGDVVVVEGGGGYGRSDYLSADLVGWGFQNHVIRARPRPGHYGPFFDFLVKAIRASGQFEALGSFATIPNVSSDKLARIRYAIPPFEEQRAIADHIRTGVTEIGRLTGKVNEVVALLRERRAALISATVTGKIDVRTL